MFALIHGPPSRQQARESSRKSRNSSGSNSTPPRCCFRLLRVVMRRLGRGVVYPWLGGPQTEAGWSALDSTCCRARAHRGDL